MKRKGMVKMVKEGMQQVSVMVFKGPFTKAMGSDGDVHRKNRGGGYW